MNGNAVSGLATRGPRDVYDMVPDDVTFYKTTYAKVMPEKARKEKKKREIRAVEPSVQKTRKK